MAEINSGSNEMALKLSDAIKAVDLLLDSQVAVLGGDVLTDSSGKLSYTYENWYCKQLSGENPLGFCRRSQIVAREFIDKLIKRGDETLFVVLVYSELGVV